MAAPLYSDAHPEYVAAEDDVSTGPSPATPDEKALPVGPIVHHHYILQGGVAAAVVVLIVWLSRRRRGYRALEEKSIA